MHRLELLNALLYCLQMLAIKMMAGYNKHKEGSATTWQTRQPFMPASTQD